MDNFNDVILWGTIITLIFLCVLRFFSLQAKTTDAGRSLLLVYGHVWDYLFGMVLKPYHIKTNG